jgi:type I restriction enzyme S subunit
LGEVVDFFNGFAFKSKDVIETSNTQLIRMGNLYQNQLSLERRAVFYPDDFAITYKKFLLKANDLIISLTGTTDKEDYGYTVKIPENEYNLLLNQRIAKISIKNETATNKDYLFHFLLSRTFLDKLYKTANGTRQANLSTETMKGLSIKIPNIKQQQIIVQKLDALSTETKKLEAIYQQKINDLEELKKSVLQKAFSGELKTAKELVL